MVIADEGFDEKALVEEIRRRGAVDVIPVQEGRKERRAIDPHMYRERKLCDRSSLKAERCQRVATRYEKKAAN